LRIQSKASVNYSDKDGYPIDVGGGGQPQFNGNAIKQIKIPLSSLAEQEIIEANKRLIERIT